MNNKLRFETKKKLDTLRNKVINISLLLQSKKDNKRFIKVLIIFYVVICYYTFSELLKLFIFKRSLFS